MEKTDQDILEHKLLITNIAAELYLKHGERFTLHQVAAEADLSVGEIFDYFDTKQEILAFYYSSLIIRYRLMIDEIDDFETYTLSEKFSNFIFASFDLMSENEQFVKLTFKPFVLRSLHKTDYQKRVQDLFAEFIKNDNLVSASSSYMLNECSFNFLQFKYLRLVSFWLNDKSEDKQVTVELTDKVTALLQEVLYSSVADRSIDLAKFFYSNLSLSCDNRFCNKISSTFEIQ